MKKYKIGIIGTGFVGSACEIGFEKIAKIKTYDKFKNSESLESCVNGSDILFICLPTPTNEDGSCNLSIIESVLQEINDICNSGKIIVMKSTIPPGSTKKYASMYPGHVFLFNPEFLTQINFINDFLTQDRIILGTTKDCKQNKIMVNFYKDFTFSQVDPGQVYVVDSDVAEMVKYMGNCLLSTKVIFCNEIYQICKEANIDYDKVSELTALDERIGPSHMKVPCNGDFGFGGACFYKDLNSLIFFAKEVGVDPLILESVLSKNLLVRQKYDWEKLAQVNGEYKKKC